MEQTEFNLTIIKEGLMAISASSSEQLALNKDGLTHLDDVFDPMPLDYLPWLEQKRKIDSDFAEGFRQLYHAIKNSVGHLEWQEEDAYISQNGSELQQWRKVAINLLGALNGV